MALLKVDTGDLVKWAEKMEEKGAEFGAEVMKQVKGHHERKRKKGLLKFERIRRRKSGIKRFATIKDKNRAVELANQSTTTHFKDVFK